MGRASAFHSYWKVLLDLARNIADFTEQNIADFAEQNEAGAKNTPSRSCGLQLTGNPSAEQRRRSIIFRASPVRSQSAELC